ncbi:MAG: porin [Flavobacteriales bacterium]|nr:porin [Flavobacteriales bacterium]
MKKSCYAIVIFLLTLSSQAFSQSKILESYKKGFSIMSKDSTFFLKPGFRFQTRFETAGDLDGNEKWGANFLIRRARLKFDGYAFSPNIVYKVELALSPNDLKATKEYKEAGGAAKVILDAVIKWRFQKNLTLWFGQTKQPGNRQRLVSSQKLQLVDRGLVNSIFNIDRDIGVQLHGKFKIGKFVIKPIFAFAKGEGRNIISQNIGGFSYTGKLELLPMGDFTKKGDYFEADLKRESKPKLALAASANYNQGSAREKQTGVFLLDTAGEYLTNNVLTVFADMMFKYKGFSLTAEYAFKKTLLKSGQSLSATDSTIVSESGKVVQTGQGVMVQAGYLFKHNWELAARYTTVIPDWNKSFTGQNEYTLGITKYVVGHKLKVQTDVTFIDKFGTSTNNLRYRLQVEIAF